MHSVKLGAFHRTVQILAVLYIIVYAIIIRQGYQEYSKVSGIVYTKAKGLGYTENSAGQILDIFDTNDLVEPPTEADALFITTGFISTIQTRSTCDSAIPCTSNANCSGFTTDGQVLTCDTANGYCFVQAWCPLENDTTAAIQVLQGVQNITVFLRSSVKYETFNIYQADNPSPVPGVNLFTLQQIVGNTNLTNCALSGCIVAVQIDWTCNFNNETCGPSISFVPITGGFNFRSVNYAIGQTSRELEKRYGVRLLMQITGTGSRFSFFQMVITIGSGAAFITLATVITDLILMAFYSKEEAFLNKKWSHMRFNKGATAPDEV